MRIKGDVMRYHIRTGIAKQRSGVTVAAYEPAARRSGGQQAAQDARRPAILGGMPPSSVIARLAGAGVAQRARIVGRLQEAYGNKAVRNLVQAQPTHNSRNRHVGAAHSEIQRQPQPTPTPTIDVRERPMADKGQEAIRQSALTQLPIWAESFSLLWYTANNGALGAMPEPEDPDFEAEVGAQAKLAFGTSLAGNLIWAATCLVAPEEVVLIRAMSFGGATVGSGTMGVLGNAPVKAMPGFKIVAAGGLARARDSLSGQIKSKVKDVASQCAAANISDLEAQKQKLWAQMFSTPYDVSEAILNAGSAKLAAASQSFVAQWRAYKRSRAVTDAAAKRTDERIKRDGYPFWTKVRIWWEPSGPGGPADAYWLEVYNEELPKYAAQTFVPVIK